MALDLVAVVVGLEAHVVGVLDTFGGDPQVQLSAIAITAPAIAQA